MSCPGAFSRFGSRSPSRSRFPSRVSSRSATRGTLRQRNRGGPRSEAERERGSALRARAVSYDFRYIGSDLRWILGTTGASVAAVLVLWAILRL